MRKFKKTGVSHINNYYPAKLTKGKIWYISYYIRNPYTEELERIRIKVNRIKNLQERARYCRKVLIELNNKLYNGWNPYLDDNSTRMFVKLTDAINTYKESKYRDIEKNSKRSYDSFLNRFLDWLEKYHPDISCSHFCKRHASDFMIFIRDKKNISGSTYNNYLTYFRSVFAWLEKMDYVPENYFKSIDKAKKLTKKVRRTFTNDELKTLIEFLKSENERYLAICMLCYYSLLRPDDIIKLRASDFDLKNSVIKIDASRTKNDHDSLRVIPEALEPFLKCLDLENRPSNEFLFTLEKFTAGTKNLDARKVAKYWANKVRKGCGFGMDLQFYSLKDTGITNMMADGISPLYVQGQTDHHSIEVTEKYTHKKTPEGFEQIRKLSRKI
jgi:integrase/recombinase XerD